MSATKIYDIINSLAFTNNEKTTLHSYFYKNSGEIDKVINVLDSQTPEAELDFMKETSWYVIKDNVTYSFNIQCTLANYAFLVPNPT